MRRTIAILKVTGAEMRRDNALMLAAAVAFYAIFSLAPLFLLLLHAGALFFGREAARAQLIDLVRDTTGPDAARAAARLMVAVSDTDGGATAVSMILLLLASSAVFRHLKAALNLVLDVPTKEDRGFLRYLKSRLFAALMAVTGIVIVITALGATAVLAWLRANAHQALARAVVMWRGAEVLVSFGVITIVFVIVLKFVPDIRLKWRHAAGGAALAALVFTAGQFLLSLYISRTSFTAVYGAAGSVVLLLLYVYFTVAVILAAAELTGIFARGDLEFRRDRRRLQESEHYHPRKPDHP